jgi:heat shock protein HslJ
MKIKSIINLFLVSVLGLAMSCTYSKPSSNAQRSLDSLNNNSIDDTIQSLPSIAQKVTSLKADLTKMKWRLIFLSTIKNDTEPFKKDAAEITFNNDGTFNAKFCNNISGNYTLDEEKGTIVLSKIIKAEMFCQGNLMKAEDALKPGIYQLDIIKGRLNLNADHHFFSFDRESTSQENPMAN